MKYFHALKGPIIGALSVATPAILCHKEPARRKNTPYELRPRGISCSSLVLYGIRILGFHARKGPIRGGFLPMLCSSLSPLLFNKRKPFQFRNPTDMKYFSNKFISFQENLESLGVYFNFDVLGNSFILKCYLP